MRFPFAPVPSATFGPMKRPLVPVVVSGPKQTVRCSFLLDSGADISMIPYSLGEMLGLSTEGADRGECKGIGEGLLACHLCQVEIKLGHIRLSIRVGWSTLEETPLLLGRMDVFDKLDIEFSEHSNTIALRPVFD